MNHYLVTPAGRSVGSRLLPGLVLAAVFGVPFVIGGGVVAIGVALTSPAITIAGVGLLLLLLLVGPGLVFWSLLRAKRCLVEGGAAWFRGDSARAIQCAHFVLAWVFRSDLRTGAFHLLGLTAEADREFGLAYELFSAAKDMTPMALTSRLRGKLHSVLEAHLALTAAAGGRTDLAQAALARGWQQVQLAQLPAAALDFLFDDSAMPLPRFISVASNVDAVETRRDPRGLLLLAGTLAAFRGGSAKLAADAGAHMQGWIGTLLPREALLFQTVMVRALGETGGPHRSPPVATPPHGDPMQQAWVDGALGL